MWMSNFFKNGNKKRLHDVHAFTKKKRNFRNVKDAEQKKKGKGDIRGGSRNSFANNPKSII